MSSAEPAAGVDFAYDAAFYFDSLPNSLKQAPAQGQQQSTDPEPLSPKWYPAAKAPVPFSEDVFWSVLERWILEAPSIIPPVAKVEILYDRQNNINNNDATSSTEKVPGDSTPISYAEPQGARAQLLLESRITPFRTVQRRLLPKRAAKDPVMNEWLYYTRSSPTSHAIFAPELTPTNNHDDIQTTTKTLPFYYPKVRGFRYGYIADPEEAPEDRDDHHHDNDQGESGSQGQDLDYEYEQDAAATGEKDSAQDPTRERKSDIRRTGQRLGWITLDLFLAGDENVFTDKVQYSFKELFRKLFKWGVNATKGFTESRVQHDVMVPKELYLRTYARLKEKHAQRWVQSWPEKTDPRKFVFEDIAIASWLVSLWSLERAKSRKDQALFGSEDQSKEAEEQKGQEVGEEQDESSKSVDITEEVRKQTFVDLGCGNGLLTHILNEEGHRGTGIDLVSRKVWAVYGAGTQLEAKTIIPNETVFDNVDWIIGNHADELAPWIPIMAMRSNPWTKFVVIPCCFFDLNGSRYQFPKGAPDGKYKAYQEYICNIIEICGYELQKEILRIPSTKNVALVGMTRKRKREPQTCHSVHNDQQSDGQGNENKDDQDCREQVDELVRRSGLFVARISDKDKQVLQRERQSARLLTRELAQEQELEHKI